MELPFYQIDAFTSRVFGGNPAGVVPLLTGQHDRWPATEVLQAIAEENNLAETAFFLPASPATRALGADYDLRWFTPTLEMDLCGHATLASSFVLHEYLSDRRPTIRFHSRSGILTTHQTSTPQGVSITLDFPSRPGAVVDSTLIREKVAAALGAKFVELRSSRDYLAVFASEAEVRALRPDMAAVAALDTFAVIATAPAAGGTGFDFVSRFFAPGAGVPEDPVTGSAHCTLIPYWAERLGGGPGRVLRAKQISRRGGELMCRLMPDAAGDRVHMAGHAATYLTGAIRCGTL